MTPGATMAITKILGAVDTRTDTLWLPTPFTTLTKFSRNVVVGTTSAGVVWS